MAITSTKTFTETVDIGDYADIEKVIETSVAYYGTLRKSCADDYTDIFSFTPDESGYYRLSWEFSLPHVAIAVATRFEYYSLGRTKVASDRLIAMEAGVKYSIFFSDYRTDKPAIDYGFDLHHSGERATSGDDLVKGTAERNVLYGFEGQDTIVGFAKHDMLYGGEGHDLLSAGGGLDILYGGLDDDTLVGGAQRDTLYGGDGADLLSGGAGNDILTGSGDLYGGADADTITGESRGGGESNRLYGGNGADILRAARHEGNLGDRLHGGIGNDLLYGSTGRDTLDGGLGRDTILGSAGRDRILLGADVKAPDVVQYTHVSQSKSSFGLDRISGFTSGIDVLDFEGIDASDTAEGNQILLYGGETALANGLWHQLVDGDTHVFLDVDGDALADMQVILKGVTTVAGGDFIL